MASNIFLLYIILPGRFCEYVVNNSDSSDPYMFGNCCQNSVTNGLSHLSIPRMSEWIPIGIILEFAPGDGLLFNKVWQISLQSSPKTAQTRIVETISRHKDIVSIVTVFVEITKVIKPFWTCLTPSEWLASEWEPNTGTDKHRRPRGTKWRKEVIKSYLFLPPRSPRTIAKLLLGTGWSQKLNQSWLNCVYYFQEVLHKDAGYSSLMVEIMKKDWLIRSTLCLEVWWWVEG